MTNLININLETLTASELKNLAKEFKVKNWWTMKKADLISELFSIQETYKKAEEETQKKEESPKPQVKKTKTPKVEKNEENLVTLKELASEFHMKGTKARRLLRNETAARPFGGNRWEWDKNLHQKELELARSILKAHTK
jgi:YesN/AraC family two-component response regulator